MSATGPLEESDPPPPAPTTAAEAKPPIDPEPHGASTRAIWSTLAIVLAFAGIAAWSMVRDRFGAHPTPAQCAHLYNLYMDHLVRAADPDAKPAAFAAQRAEGQPGADEAAARCAAHVSLDQAACAERAGNADEFERCLQ